MMRSKLTVMTAASVAVLALLAGCGEAVDSMIPPSPMA